MLQVLSSDYETRHNAKKKKKKLKLETKKKNRQITSKSATARK